MNEDCDDTDPAVSPDAAEAVRRDDNDCDGNADAAGMSMLLIPTMATTISFAITIGRGL